MCVCFRLELNGHRRLRCVCFRLELNGHKRLRCVCFRLELNGHKRLRHLCFRLELNGHRRRLTWEATPRSIHDGVQAAINTSDCLVFDTNIAQLFADNGNLGINVTINMCQQ